MKRKFPKKRLLVGCERSGIVRDAFRQIGWDAVSCDIEESRAKGPHIQDDVLYAIRGGDWDMLIAHPPCTFLARSGLHWNARVEGRDEDTELALDFVRRLMESRISRICIENPAGRIGTAIREADQYIQPYWFGDDASKSTGLWLKNLPLLTPTKFAEPRVMLGDGVDMFGFPATPRWSNQTDSGNNKVGPQKRRQEIRSQTYPGIARAMAAQWGSL